MQSNLKDFITQTLLDIAQGVSDAAAKTKKIFEHDGSMHNGKESQVNFDLAVTVTDSEEKTGGGKTGINIQVIKASVGAEVNSTSSVEAVSRISFSVPIYLSIAEGKR